MDVSRFECGQQLRVPARGAGNGDSFVRHALCKVEYSDAVVEHRGQSLFEIQTTGVDFAQMSDQFGFECVVAVDQDLEILQELVIGKTVQ